MILLAVQRVGAGNGERLQWRKYSFSVIDSEATLTEITPFVSWGWGWVVPLEATSAISTVSLMLFSDTSDVHMRIRFGWRWAFLIQLPLFALSFFLTSTNLRYVTPVS